MNGCIDGWLTWIREKGLTEAWHGKDTTATRDKKGRKITEKKKSQKKTNIGSEMILMNWHEFENVSGKD